MSDEEFSMTNCPICFAGMSEISVHRHVQYHGEECLRILEKCMLWNVWRNEKK
jgi:hypothetical protein